MRNGVVACLIMFVLAANMGAMSRKECEKQRWAIIGATSATQVLLPQVIFKTLLKKDFMSVSKRIKVCYALYAGLSGCILGEQLFRQTSASQFLTVEKKQKLLFYTTLRKFVQHVFVASHQNLAIFYKDVERIYRHFDVPLVTCYKRLEQLNQESEYIEDTIHALQKNILINQEKRSELLDERLRNALEAKKTIQAAMHALKKHPRWQEESSRMYNLKNDKNRERIDRMANSNMAK